MKKENSFFLIGPMGAGKTTVGRQLAAKLQLQFLDTDHVLVERLGVSVPTIFSIEGEDGFRGRETKVLKELVELPNIVLATGGGIILREENHELLHKGRVIYLAIDPYSQFERIKDDRNRPLLQTENPQATLLEMNEDRSPLYEKVADLTVDVADKKPDQVTNEIIKALCK